MVDVAVDEEDVLLLAVLVDVVVEDEADELVEADEELEEELVVGIIDEVELREEELVVGITDELVVTEDVLLLVLDDDDVVEDVAGNAPGIIYQMLLPSVNTDAHVPKETGAFMVVFPPETIMHKVDDWDGRIIQVL